MNVTLLHEKEKKLNEAPKISLCSTNFCISKGKNIILYGSYRQKDKTEITLIGHQSEITTLKFVTINKELNLLSAASDYLISWDVEEVSVADSNGDKVRGHVIGRCFITPHCICIFGKIVCLTSSDLLVIYDLDQKKILMEIKSSNISATEFLNESILLTSTFNGSILIRDLNNGGQIISKFIPSVFGVGANFLSSSIFMDHFAVGSSSSLIYEFHFDQEKLSIKENFHFDLNQILFHIQYSNKTAPINEVSQEQQVLATIYTNQQFPGNTIFNSRRLLLLATEQAIYAIDVDSHDVTAHLFTTDDVTPFINDAIFYRDDDDSKVICMTSSTFGNNIQIYSIDISDDVTFDISTISFSSSDPLVSSSPLWKKIEKVKKKPEKKLEKNLTFQKKIQSSGYTSSPRMGMFKPKTNFKKPKNRTSKLQSSDLMKIEKRVCDWSNFEASDYISLNRKSEKVTSIKSTEKMISVGFSDSTVFISNLPLQQNSSPKSFKSQRVLTHHQKEILSCDWSNSGNLLMTSSADNTIALWNPSKSSELLLDVQVKIFKNRAINSAQFFFGDRFVMTSQSNSHLLYSYQLHEGPKDDVKRYLNVGTSKLIGNWSMEEAQAITCSTAANHVNSYVMMRASSQKVVEVFDMNHCKVVRRWEQVHQKPPHIIRLDDASDVFVTSSQGDGIKLWDLRIKKCLHKFHHHSCVSKCDVIISDCLRYLSSGTDDKNICLYDLRQNLPLKMLTTKNKTTKLCQSIQMYAGDNLGGVEIFC